MAAKITRELIQQIQEYDKIGEEAAVLRERRSQLKKAIVAFLFPKPVEGTNKAEAPGYLLLLTHKFKREVDGILFNQITPNLIKHKVPVDDIMNWKAYLALPVYRKLNQQQTHILDNCITTKPESPDLDVTKVTA